MNNIAKIVLYFSLAILAPWFTDADTDYCKSAYCYGATHIACGNHNFDKSCHSDAKLVKITPDLEKIIVNRFNEKRNLVAGGKKTILKAACRMGTMHWDKELAKLAELNVKQCKMNHDSCHNTETYQTSGQNLAWMTFIGTPNDTQNLLRSVDMWYDEIQHMTQEIIDKYPKDYKGPVVGHFTAMMFEQNIAVGCAGSTYSTVGKDQKNYLVACNMAYTNMIGSTVYKTCDNPASKCETGTNPKYPNLCKESESYKEKGGVVKKIIRVIKRIIK